MLIPAELVALWRGAIDPATEAYSELNREEPQTDYDRACAAAWPGRGELRLGKSSALVIYSESDEHAWMEAEGIVAAGGWFPTALQLQQAVWTDSFTWQADHENYLLLNSAADGKSMLRSDDYMRVELKRGIYTVDFALIEDEYLGCFTKLTHIAPAVGA